MPKQLLICESAAPVSALRHGAVSHEPVGNYAPMQAQVTAPGDHKVSLGGFMAVPRNKLRALAADALAALARPDELELLYSKRNFNEVKHRFIGSLAQVEALAATTEG